MPEYQCPFCGEMNGRWLSEISEHAPVNYYRCDCCYHVWNVPKRSPAVPPKPSTLPGPPMQK